ncbi:hypothetical protein KIH87_12220 [Paraneptunicella aestuarii]|uniref:hypothetical protein n=1 Tax=Paraneptunicella aestuarii TaxID=2831148 RepID=UPI001E6397DE|nr:hypothetical protein [Paraneptunicella aestuarii]UAA37478.1 hypothetical protein KIH87_12220 [Paraneptunicella aestuarii]
MNWKYRKSFAALGLLLLGTFSHAALAVSPTASISWSPSTVGYGQSSTLTWSSTNATGCVMNGTARSTSGSWVGTNRTANQTVSFYCTGSGGTSSTQYATLTVVPPPTASLSWSPSTVNYGDSSTLTWSSTNATGCVLNGASRPANGSWRGDNRTVTQTSNLYCQGLGGTSSTVSATLTVLPPPKVPTASLSWSPSTVSYAGSSRLSWSSSDATACIVDGQSKGTSGYIDYSNQLSNKTSSVYCTGAGGSSSTKYAVLTVGAPPSPTTSIAWSPSVIEYNGAATLTWSSNNATSCTLDGVSVATSNSLQYTDLTTSKTSVLNCTGAGGSSGDKLSSLTVNPQQYLPVLTVDLNNNGTIAGTASDGDFAKELRVSFWFSPSPYSSTNREYGAIINTTSGNYQYTIPTKYLDGTYDVRVFAMDVNSDGTETGDYTYQTITVPAPPSPQVTAVFDKDIIMLGESVTLSWIAQDATSCFVDGSEETSPITFIPNARGAFSKTVACEGYPGTSRSDSTANATVEVLPTLTAHVTGQLITGSASDGDFAKELRVSFWFSPSPYSSTNREYGAIINTTSGNYQYTIPTKYLDGTYDVRVFAMDVNSDGTETGDYTYQTIAIPTPSSLQVTATFDKTEAEAGSEVKFSWETNLASTCSIDGVEKTSPVTYTPTTKGTFSKTVICKGPNTEESDATASVSIVDSPVYKPTLTVNIGDYVVSGKIFDQNYTGGNKLTYWFSQIPENNSDKGNGAVLAASTSYRINIPVNYQSGGYYLNLEAVDVDAANMETGNYTTKSFLIDAAGTTIRDIREKLRKACDGESVDVVAGIYEVSEAYALGEFSGCGSFDASYMRVIYSDTVKQGFTVLKINSPEQDLKLPNLAYHATSSADLYNVNSIGIHLNNVQNKRIEIGNIQNWETGLLITNSNANELEVSYLENNKVNLRLENSKENTFLGGSYSHWSKSSRQWQFSQLETLEADNNTWFGTCMEGVTGEMPIAVSGNKNIFYNVRWEGVTSYKTNAEGQVVGQEGIAGFNGSRNLIYFGQHSKKLSIGPAYWFDDDEECPLNKERYASGVEVNSGLKDTAGNDIIWSHGAVIPVFEKINDVSFYESGCKDGSNDKEPYWSKSDQFDKNGIN